MGVEGGVGGLGAEHGAAGAGASHRGEGGGWWDRDTHPDPPTSARATHASAAGAREEVDSWYPTHSSPSASTDMDF